MNNESKETQKEESSFILTDDNIPKFKEPLKPTIIKNTQKKTPVVLILLIVIVFIGCAIFGVKYYMENIKNSNKTNSNNNASNNEVNNSKPDDNPSLDDEQKEEAPKEETIKISEEELTKYLSYIPMGINDDTVPYYNQKSSVTEIDKTLLVSMSLGDENEFKVCEDENNCLPETVTSKGYIATVNCFMDGHCDPKGYDFFPLSKVNNNLKKMYNIEFNKLEINEYDTWRYGGYEIMYYNNGFLEREASGWTDSVTHTIDKYEATKDELIIYDYAINSCTMCDGPIDFLNSNAVKYSFLEETHQSLNDYIREHKDDFTLFKHTFKKNELGYYWYNTEVVEKNYQN